MFFDCFARLYYVVQSILKNIVHIWNLSRARKSIYIDRSFRIYGTYYNN